MVVMTLLVSIGFLFGVVYEYKIYKRSKNKRVREVFFAGFISAVGSLFIYCILMVVLVLSVDKPIVVYKKETMTVVPSEVSLNVGCARKGLLIYCGGNYSMNVISEFSQKISILQIPKDSFSILDTKSEEVSFLRLYSRCTYPDWMKWFLPEWIVSKINFERDITYEVHIPENKIIRIE